MKTSATGCSVEEAMRLLGGRWRLLLVSYLLDGAISTTRSARSSRNSVATLPCWPMTYARRMR